MSKRKLPTNEINAKKAKKAKKEVYIDNIVVETKAKKEVRIIYYCSCKK